MKKCVSFSALAMLLSACQSAPATVDLAITDASVIDIASGSVAHNRTVLINDGVIVDVVDQSFGHSFVAAETFDADGDYLMPGLWDMHVHLHVGTPAGLSVIDPAQWHVPLSLSYGVTGMRDMASRMDDILALRDELDLKRQANLAAPDLIIAGTLFSGPQPWGEPDHAVIPDSADAAREQVAMHIERGVDFIKVHDFLSPDIYRAIVDEAILRDYPAIGHLRSDVGPLAAADLGQKDFEHIPPELLAYCSADGQARTRNFYDDWFKSGPDYFWRAKAALYDADGCDALFKELADKEVTITPTLILRKPVSEERLNLAMSYLPEPYAALCEEGKTQEAALGPSIFKNYDDVMAEVVSSLSDAGVTLLTGTDRQTYACGVPGWDVTQELKALTEAGLSRRQALQSATIVPARKAGYPFPGQIVAGASADLILLSDNPLDTLDALEAPSAVISAGDYLSVDELVALREQAKRYAASFE